MFDWLNSTRSKNGAYKMWVLSEMSHKNGVTYFILFYKATSLCQEGPTYYYGDQIRWNNLTRTTYIPLCALSKGNYSNVYWNFSTEMAFHGCQSVKRNKQAQGLIGGAEPEALSNQFPFQVLARPPGVIIGKALFKLLTTQSKTLLPYGGF